MERRKSRQVRAGNLLIGGGAPLSVQSMTSLPVEDVEGTVAQIHRMEAQGVDLVRLALRRVDSVKYFSRVRKEVSVPLCADIHFDYRIALAAIDAGVNKVRINPGNIGSAEKVEAVVRAARDAGIPIRIGVNGGSLDKKKYPEVTPENMVESAMEHVRILEELDFHDTVISIKSSDMFQTIEANRLLAKRCDYPVHVGLTEAGYGLSCVVQSSMAIGTLLMEGIGDTIRVSMTGDPVEEVLIGKRILETVGMRFSAVKMISCPTCGRTDPSLNILSLAQDTEEAIIERFGRELESRQRRLVVAVMGCEVNGPGEAAHADIGLAGGRNGEVLLFSAGMPLYKVQQKDAVVALVAEVEKLLTEDEGLS